MIASSLDCDVESHVRLSQLVIERCKRMAETGKDVFLLMDSITRGVGSLVDADMNQESAKLQALQVQQQLGVQSLSIANQNVQLILKLVGGG